MADCPELKKLHWRCVVIDEAHRLKNRNCKLLEGLKLMNLVSLSICLMIRMYSTCGNDVMFVKYNLHQWLLSYVIVDWSVLRWKSKNKCNQQLFRSLCQLVHPPFGGDSFRPRRQTFDMEVRSLCVCAVVFTPIDQTVHGNGLKGTLWKFWNCENHFVTYPSHDSSPSCRRHWEIVCMWMHEQATPACTWLQLLWILFSLVTYTRPPFILAHLYWYMFFFPCLSFFLIRRPVLINPIGSFSVQWE